MTNYNLQRFLDAQRGDYEQALAEVRNGAEIFPLDLVYISSTERIGHEL